MFEHLSLAVIPCIGAICLFTYLSIATYTGTRYAERKSYYDADMLKKISEHGGESNPALEYLREQARIEERKKIEGMKIGGLVNVGVGAGVMVLLYGMVPQNHAVALCGLVLLLIGAALLAYVFWFAKPTV